ncbi:hypothetical protein FHG87_012270 [Trinorchestia longiramus]|nr:hypothetical protein FHG87_012270 [Trinorchestia longiramus]
MGEVLISANPEAVPSKEEAVPEKTIFNDSHVSGASDSDDEINISSIRSKKLSKLIISDDEDDFSEPRSEPPDNESASSLSEVNPATASQSTPASQPATTSSSVTSLSRITRPVESDSEDEDSPLQPTTVSSLEEPKKKYKYNRAIFDVDDESDEEASKPRQASPPDPPQCWKSDEELEEDRILSIARSVHSKNEQKPVKAKKVSESAARAQRETEMATIRSESQRRVRDGPISLPYHRPKQRTLQDFLNRKKKEGLPLPVSRCDLRRSMKNMDVLRQLEIRKKEAVEFYKSDSDELDSDDEWKPNERGVKTAVQSEDKVDALVVDCPEAKGETADGAKSVEGEKLSVNIGEKNQSNISDTVEESYKEVKGCALVDGAASVICQSSNTQCSYFTMVVDESNASVTNGLTGTRSYDDEVELQDITTDPTKKAEDPTEPSEADKDEPESAKTAQLEIRKKEAVEFYKSDSDELDSDDEWKPNERGDKTAVQSEDKVDALVVDCPEAKGETADGAKSVEGEKLSVNIGEKNRSNISDAVEESYKEVKGCALVDGAVSVVCQSSNTQCSDFTMVVDESNASVTNGLTGTRSYDDEVELQDITTDPTKKAEDPTEPSEADKDEPESAKTAFELTAQDIETSELHPHFAENDALEAEPVVAAVPDQDTLPDDHRSTSGNNDSSRGKKSTSLTCEEDEDEFLSNLDDDASFLKFPESGKSRLETQDLIDEEMPQLLLEDGPDDDGDVNECEHLPRDDGGSSLRLSSDGRISRQDCHPNDAVSFDSSHPQNTDEPSVKSACTSRRESATSTPTPLPPRLSLLASKLGGSITVNISPAPRLTQGSKQPDMIDLDDDFSTPKTRDPGLVDLMDRFTRHSTTKRHTNKPQQVTMSIVSKEKDSEGKEQLVSSSVIVSLEGEQETILSQCSTPGAKMQRLKDGLRAQIHERRVRATREKQIQKNFMETEELQPETEDPFALPEDEDEAELTESSEGESEPEFEDDVQLSDKPRARSDFVDDEAEEDEDEVEEAETGEKIEEDDHDDVEEIDEEEARSSDDDEVVLRKPVSKSKKESRKSALVVDSDDEAEVDHHVDSNSPESCSVPLAPLEKRTNFLCRDAAHLGKEGSHVDASLLQRASDAGDSPETIFSAPQRLIVDDEEQDLPDTQPVSSPSKTSPSAGIERRADSTARCSSLDDSSSLELQGSCIPAHQPVRSAQRVRHTDIPSSAAGHGCSLGLESSSVDLLWCPVDNSSSKASNAQFPSSTLLPIADDATDNITEGDGGSQATFTTSQEMRLDFRGLTGSQEQRLDGELPDLLSGRFTGPSMDVPIEEDVVGLTGLCTGQFTGSGGLLGSHTSALPTLPDDLPSMTLGALPDVPLSLPPMSPSVGVPTPPTQPSTDRPDCNELSDTVLLTQSNETQIGLSVSSELGPEHDELLDLCSGDFTDVVSEKKRTVRKAPLPSGQSKLTHFFTRGPPIRKKNGDDEGNSVQGSAAAVVNNTSEMTALKNLSVPDKKSPTRLKQLGPKDGTKPQLDSTVEECVVKEHIDSSSSSSEEEEVDVEDDNRVSAKKRRRILLLDDDDDDDDDSGQNAKRVRGTKADEAKKDTIVSEAEDESNEEDDDEDEQPKVRVYDDEENEVPMKWPSFKDREKGGIRADFLENEAELSGSDMDSDEEEREEDDYMDEEEADKEHYDEEQLREQIGQTHIRGELARDQREVRLLQELYLEDGDLHGEGRQRTFRWKNLDESEDNGARPADDSDDAGDAEEEEEEESSQWRKERFEREQFLKKKMENEGEELEAEEEALVLGLSGKTNTSLLKANSIPVISKRTLQAKTTDAPTKSNNASSPTKKPLVLANPENSTTLTSNPLILARQSSLPSQLSKCGSFLSRGASKLARLAALIKERNDGSQGGPATANASGNFIFQSLTAEEAQLRRHAAVTADTCKAQQKAVNKRPAPIQSQNQSKKPRYDLTRNSARSSRSSIFKHL